MNNFKLLYHTTGAIVCQYIHFLSGRGKQAEKLRSGFSYKEIEPVLDLAVGPFTRWIALDMTL